MRQRPVALVAALLVALALPAGPAQAGPPEPVAGFEFPESALWDVETDSFYVTNFGGSTINPNGRETDGYITKLDGEGRVVAARWVTGLRSPKGIKRRDGFLYVADAGQLVVVDVATAAIAATIDLDALGAQLPNDVALDPATGDLYVSDLLRNAVYRLPRDSSTPEVFLETPDLEAPNGLLVDGGRLLVAGYGRDLDRSTFRPAQPGRVLTVDLASKRIAPLGSMGPTGQLDGIEKLGDAYLVTDNPGGRLLRVAADGSMTELARDIPSAADLGIRPDDRLVAIPQLRQATVRFLIAP